MDNLELLFESNEILYNELPQSMMKKYIEDELYLDKKSDQEK
jgi:hypothetical protein